MEKVRVAFNGDHVSKKEALRGIDLNIPEGQFVTVIGSNGAGKSTLLNSLAGDVPITEGKLRIGNADVTSWPAAHRAALISRIFQDPLAGTCPDLTIEENLALATPRTRRRGFMPAIGRQERKHFRYWLSQLRLGIEDRLADPVGLLSGGQRQAISIVMASLRPTKILLLDEPTAALDPQMQGIIIQLVRKTVEDHKLTALMVTHSMHQALDLGNRTIMLHNGRLILDVADEARRRLDASDLSLLFREGEAATLDTDSLPCTNGQPVFRSPVHNSRSDFIDSSS